jgi:hypothetical protein
LAKKGQQSHVQLEDPQTRKEFSEALAYEMQMLVEEANMYSKFVICKKVLYMQCLFDGTWTVIAPLFNLLLRHHSSFFFCERSF